MACVIVLSTGSLRGRGYSRQSLMQLNIQVVHPASRRLPGSPGNFVIITCLPRQLCLQGEKCWSRQHQQSHSAWRFHFSVGFIFWSHETGHWEYSPDRRVPSRCASKSGFRTSRLGLRGWGMRQGKSHLVRCLGGHQQPPLGVTPASSRGFWRL